MMCRYAFLLSPLICLTIGVMRTRDATNSAMLQYVVSALSKQLHQSLRETQVGSHTDLLNNLFTCQRNIDAYRVMPYNTPPLCGTIKPARKDPATLYWFLKSYQNLSLNLTFLEFSLPYSIPDCPSVSVAISERKYLNNFVKSFAKYKVPMECLF